MRWRRSRKKRALTMQSLQQVRMDVRVAVLLRSAGACWYGGVPLTMSTVTLDHRVPVRHGGQTVLDNLVASCRTCNVAKDHLSLEAFRRQRGGTVFWGEKLQSGRGS